MIRAQDLTSMGVAAECCLGDPVQRICFAKIFDQLPVFSLCFFLPQDKTVGVVFSQVVSERQFSGADPGFWFELKLSDPGDPNSHFLS